jgi:hypothetical protein
MRRICLALLFAAVAAGCGGTPSQPAASSTTADPPGARPALLTAPRQPGEVVVHAATSPVTAGPFAFHGTYRVRFEQYAPEAPAMDFAGQTAFLVDLERSPGMPAVRLFRAAAGKGERRLRLDGRLYVDVSFGDFPFVIRFTPDRR